MILNNVTITLRKATIYLFSKYDGTYYAKMEFLNEAEAKQVFDDAIISGVEFRFNLEKLEYERKQYENLNLEIID